MAPDKVYGPLLAKLLQELAVSIQKECGASVIRISCEFVYSKERGGDLKLKTFTTPDAKTDRMFDPNTPLPRGSKLQHDATGRLSSFFKRLKKILGEV